MTVYSYAQLETLWIRAGGPANLAPIAAAIGEAESGGNSDALNPNDNGGRQSSFGIWQISNGTHSPPSGNWANPAVNAQLAVGKWKGAGNSFSPWGTYTSGAYRAFLSGKTSPDPNVPGSPTGVSAQVGASGAADCLVGNPISASVGLGPISIGSSVGPACLFTKSNARAFIGAAVIALSVPIGMAAIAIAAVAAGQAIGVLPGTQQVIQRGAKRIPGTQATASTATSAGEATESAVKGSGPEDDDAALEKLLGQPKENPDLEVRGGTVRESTEQREARRRRERSVARARARRSAGQGRPASREEAGF